MARTMAGPMGIWRREIRWLEKHQGVIDVLEDRPGRLTQALLQGAVGVRGGWLLDHGNKGTTPSLERSSKTGDHLAPLLVAQTKTDRTCCLYRFKFCSLPDSQPG